MRRGIEFDNRRNRSAVGRAAGFSLIEVLVVLVVLLIGILAILRLFPGGFLTIQRTGEVTMGQALVARQLDAQKNQLSVVDSVVGTDPNGNIDPTILPDDLRDLDANDPALNGRSASYFSNINRMRQVIGESFRIPIPTSHAISATPVFGGTYMLQFGPVENDFGTDANNNPTGSIAVYSAPMERLEQSSDNGQTLPAVQNPSQYAIDYQSPQNPLIAFYPRVGTGNRQFNISYSYIDNSGAAPVLKSVPKNLAGVVTVPDVPAASLPAGQPPLPVWQPLFGGPNGLKAPTVPYIFRPDSEEVSRAYKLVQATAVMPTGTGTVTAPTWSDDPYEYAFFSPQIVIKPDAPNPNANVGVLIFNPRAHYAAEQTSTGPRPLSARVDYRTYDNHVIREDRSVPGRAPYAIKLSLPFVLTNGDILSDQSSYTGMFPIVANVKTPDILAYNVNTGEEVVNLSGMTSNPSASLGLINATLDAATGTVTLDAADVQNKGLQNVTLRFFYRTQRDWGMQVQKAHSRYTQALDVNSLDYRSYYAGGGNSGGSPTRIYFSPGESGKTVVLGEYYVTATVNGQPVVKRFTNEAFQITDNPALSDLNGLPFVDLTTAHPEAAPPNENWTLTAAQTGQAVGNVQGASLKSRVIWRSSGRWRKVDNDTFLVPTPSQ
jgi:prepilin-type N-terminal cleavage/methylation domain-containing protein